jgi:hypothetical protein
MQRACENHFRIDEEVLAMARISVQVAQQGAGDNTLAYAFTTLGEFLFWHGDVNEAQEKFDSALAISERVNDPHCRLLCLSYLSLIGVRRHDVGAVRSSSSQTLAAAALAKDAMFTAAATAAMVWVAWKDDRAADVARLADGSTKLWGTIPAGPYHFKGLCLWPLMSVHLASGQLAEAVDAGRQILLPPKVRLPDELEAMIVSAGAAWDSGEAQLAANELTAALELACRLGYA